MGPTEASVRVLHCRTAIFNKKKKKKKKKKKEEAARVSLLLWFGHVQRMQSDRLPRRIMSEEVQGKRGRGRPRRRFLDSVRSDLEIRGLRLDDHTLALAQDRVAWRGLVHH